MRTASLYVQIYLTTSLHPSKIINRTKAAKMPISVDEINTAVQAVTEVKTLQSASYIFTIIAPEDS